MEGIAQADAFLLHCPHQVDPAAGRLGLEAGFPIGWTEVEAEAAVYALDQVILGRLYGAQEAALPIFYFHAVRTPFQCFVVYRGAERLTPAIMCHEQ